MSEILKFDNIRLRDLLERLDALRRAGDVIQIGVHDYQIERVYQAGAIVSRSGPVTFRSSGIVLDFAQAGDDVHVYCSSPEYARALIERLAIQIEPGRKLKALAASVALVLWPSQRQGSDWIRARRVQTWYLREIERKTKAEIVASMELLTAATYEKDKQEVDKLAGVMAIIEQKFPITFRKLSDI